MTESYHALIAAGRQAYRLKLHKNACPPYPTEEMREAWRAGWTLEAERCTMPRAG